MRESIVWLRRLVFEYGSSPPISLDLCVGDEDPSQLIIRPGWDAPHVRCFPRTFCAWPCLLRQVGTVLGSPYDYVVARLAYANPGSRQSCPLRTTSTWDYGVGPLRCSLVRGFFRRQQYRDLRRDWTAYSGSGRCVCFTGQPRIAQEYKGQGSK